MKKIVILILIIGMAFSFTPVAYSDTSLSDLVAFATQDAPALQYVSFDNLPEYVVVPVDAGTGGCDSMQC